MTRSHRGGRPSEVAEAFGQNISVSVYRLHDSVALTVGSEVVYLSRRQAQSLSRALHACGVDVVKNPDADAAKFKAFNIP